MSLPEAIPIVLLPGMDGTGELLQGLAERLAKQRPAQIVSYPLDRSLGYSGLTAYVAERLPDRPFVILGESFSGPIAIEIAATDRRVAGLILASSFARHPLPTWFAPFARTLDAGWLPKRLISAILMGRTATPELSARLHQVLATVPRKVLQDRAREVLHVDRRDRLCEINCAVLCLHGRFDRLTNEKQVGEIVGAQPRSQVHWLDASHMLLATHPEAAAKAINDFCGPLDRA